MPNDRALTRLRGARGRSWRLFAFHDKNLMRRDVTGKTSFVTAVQIRGQASETVGLSPAPNGAFPPAKNP